jgi:hypothetical protein
MTTGGNLRSWSKRWRPELVFAGGLTLGREVVAARIGYDPADLLMIAGLSAAAIPRPQALLAQRMIRVRRNRRWNDALGCVMPEPATPGLLSVGTDGWGEWATVRVAGGTTVTELASRSEHLAAYLAVDSVRVTRDTATVAVAHIRALRSDPLNSAASPWPWVDAPWTSLWWPVPVGVDDNGTTVYIELVEHNLLVGGEPGSGKSVAVSQLVAAAALDPTVSLYLLDGKLVELAAWRHIANGFAGTNIDDATTLLRTIQTLMDSRYAWLLEHGRRKIPHGAQLTVVVIDELAHYLTWPDKKPRDAFSDTLRDIVSRGRAAGVIVIAATQKPSSDVIPTSLRDLFGYRWALRATTPAASDTILGNGWATNGYTSSTITPSIRGGGYLLHEAGLPTRLRAHHLDDHTITILAARAAHVRRQHQQRQTAETETTDQP